MCHGSNPITDFLKYDKNCFTIKYCLLSSKNILSLKICIKIKLINVFYVLNNKLSN